MAPSNEWLREKIDRKRAEVGPALDDLESGAVPESNRYHLHYNVAIRYHAIGAFRLLVDEPDAGRTAFADAARHYLQSAVESRPYRHEPPTDKWRNEPIRLVRGLYCALVADDPELREECASEAVALDDEYLEENPAQLFYRAKAVGAVALDDDRQGKFVSEFETAVDPDFVPEDLAIARACRGILDGDGAEVAAGVEDLLDHHRDRIEGEPDTKSEVVSLPATALVLLARDRGLDVWVDSGFVPAVLRE